MKQLAEHWDLLVYASAIIAMAVWRVRQWIALDEEQKHELVRQRIRDLLLDWVTEAEKQLGSGTGAWKIRKAYEAAAEKMAELGLGPVFAKYVSLEEFDAMAQEYLEEMRRKLESNGAIADYVFNGKDDE